MKYQVGQILKYVGPPHEAIYPGDLGAVMETTGETRLIRMMTGAPYYTMNFPGFVCPGCAEHHVCAVHESMLRPIDDPDADEETVTDEELDEELLR